MLQGPSPRVTAYYIDFRSNVAGFVDEAFLKDEKYAHGIALAKPAHHEIYRMLSKAGGRARIDRRNLRLYVPAFAGRGEFLVDQEGRVRHAGEEFSLAPLTFLALSDYLDYLKYRQGIREGFPAYVAGLLPPKR